MLEQRGLKLSVGETVFVDGDQCQIVAVLDLERVVVESSLDRSRRTVSISALRQKSKLESVSRVDAVLDGISSENWAIAEKRLEAIRPLLDQPTRTKASVRTRAEELGISYGPLYAWIRRFGTNGLLSSLLPHDRSGGRGRSRLSSEGEALIFKTIESHFLNNQKLTPQAVYRELRIRAVEAGIKGPSAQTVRDRISKIDPSLVSRRRHGTKAQRRFLPAVGNFPEVDHPYAVIQIDHTDLDIQLVDEQYRKPIGRAYITLAIDVFSRMVAGFYISLDPTGDLSTGLCLVHTILPKREWLEKVGVDAKWPCHGFMDVIHTDNAREFRGKTLARAAAEYGITLKRRPVRQPHYGGHIERLLGTTLKQLVHSLPGSTFSNVAAKGQYDSEGNACLTIAETERIVTVWFTGSYHQTIHRALLMSPLEKYRLGRLGSPDGDSPSKVRLPEDPDRLRTDFMPSIERCILPYGVVIDDIYYWSDILRPWINATDPERRNRKRLFLFKRDPRDVSTIQFLDPVSNAFHQIPYRNIALPSMSLWELREAKKRLKKHGRKTIDEHAIFQAHRFIEAEVKSAAAKTRSARRDAARQAGRKKQGPAVAELVTRGPAVEEEEAGELHVQDIPEFKVRER